MGCYWGWIYGRCYVFEHGDLWCWGLSIQDDDDCIAWREFLVSFVLLDTDMMNINWRDWGIGS